MSRDDHTAPLFFEATRQLGALAVQIEKMNPAGYRKDKEEVRT